jgi:hypothetical protein
MRFIFLLPQFVGFLGIGDGMISGIKMDSLHFLQNLQEGRRRILVSTKWAKDRYSE